MKNVNFQEHKLVDAQSKYHSLRWLKWPIMQVAQLSLEPDETSKWGESAWNFFWGTTKSQQSWNKVSKGPWEQLNISRFPEVLEGMNFMEKKFKWGTTYVPRRETRKGSTHDWWITIAKEGNLTRADQQQLLSYIAVCWGGSRGERIVFNWGTWAIWGILK